MDKIRITVYDDDGNIDHIEDVETMSADKFLEWANALEEKEDPRVDALAFFNTAADWGVEED